MNTSSKLRSKSFIQYMLTAVLTLFLVSSFASAQTTAERVESSGVLTVGLEGTYPPFNYIDENNNMVGFDVDISNEIASRMGVKAEFVGSAWASLIGGLQSDRFDAIIAQMSITEERQQAVDFTRPYVISGAVLIARVGDDRFQELEDISGFRVGVGIGTTFETVARSVEGADVRTYDSFQEYSQELLIGRVDLIINDQLTAGFAIVDQGLPLEITSGLVSADNIGIAVKKGNEDFVDTINEVLTSMIDDGTYAEIFRKWFGTEPAVQ